MGLHIPVSPVIKCHRTTRTIGITSEFQCRECKLSLAGPGSDGVNGPDDHVLPVFRSWVMVESGYLRQRQASVYIVQRGRGGEDRELTMRVRRLIWQFGG